MKNIFEQVKESVTTKQAAMYYGMNVNQNDMVCCPFHNDRHPSMKVSEGYYCFGCGEKGDVINFVAKLHNLSQYEAAKKLALDFGLQIEKIEKNAYQNKNKKAALKEKTVRNKYQVQKDFEKWEQRCQKILSDYSSWLIFWKEFYAPKTPDGVIYEEFLEAVNNIEKIKWYQDILENSILEEKIYFLVQYGKEVIQIEKRMGEYQRGILAGIGQSND